MFIETVSRQFQKCLTTNSTQASSFAAKAVTLTEPTNDGVVNISITGMQPSSGVFMPYAVASSNDTFSIRITGWRKINTTWVPCILCEYACTVGAYTGVASGAVVATERFVDTLSLVTNMGNDGVDTYKTSPANDTPAHFVVDFKGCQKFEAQFVITSGPTSMNALWAGL